MKLALAMPVVLVTAITATAQTAPTSNAFGSLKSEKISRFVVPNVDTIIDYSFYLNPDCTLGGMAQLRVVRKPMHGEIVLAEGDQYPAYEPPNVRVSCNSRKVRAAEIHYKAADGYRGTDSADIVTIYPNGTADRYVYEITVD